MGIRIVTDTASDLNINIEKKYNINIVPLTVNIEGKYYKDRYEISSEEFFSKLNKNETPFTSQVNPIDFVDVFKEILDEGDEIIGIFLSSHLSGTYNSAMVAKDLIKSDKIHIIDSKLVSLGLGLLVEKAAEMVSEGLNILEIVESINLIKEKVKSAIIVDTLEYLRKGGRLTASQAFIGQILKLKPILTFHDGKLIPVDKVRGRKKALRWIQSWIKDNNYDLKDKTVVLAHAKDYDYLMELKEILIKEYNAKDIVEVEVGAVVGTHSGPSAIGMCFID